ncbi:MAG: translocation/assembly module TamB domain-containing protein [Bdellovibrionota bacterium]
MKLITNIFRIGLFLLALLVAAVVVLSIVLRPWAERRIERALNDFLEPACDCRFSLESVHVGYFPFDLRLGGVSAKGDEGSVVQIEKLRVSLSVIPLIKRRIVLNQISVDGVEINGLGRKSVLGNLLSRRIKPEAEGSEESSFKLEIQHVDVGGVNIREQTGARANSALGVALTAVLQKDETYSIKVSAASLRSEGPSAPKHVELGALAAQTLVGKDELKLEHLELIRNAPWLDAAGELVNGKLDGKITHHADTAELGLAELVSGVVDGVANLSGSKSRPVVSGSVTIPETNGLAVVSNGAKLVTVDSAVVDYIAAFEDGQPSLSVNTLSAFGEGAAVELAQPIRISNEGLSGGIEITAARVEHGQAKMENLRAIVLLNGTLAQPTLSADINAGNVVIAGQAVGGLSVTGNYEDQIARVALQLHPPRGTVSAEATLDIHETPRAEKISFHVINLPYPLAAAPGEETLNVTASATAEGPLTPEEIQSVGAFSIISNAIESEEMKFSGDFKVASGVLTASVSDGTPAISASARADLTGKQTGAITLQLHDIDLDRYLAKTTCGHFDANANYQFLLDTPREGNGEIKVNAFEIGCSRQKIKLDRPRSIRLSNGKIDFGDLKLQTAHGAVDLHGSVSSSLLQVRADGELEIEPFSALVPSVDEIGGKLLLHLQAGGTPTSPEFSGTVQLLGGAVLMSAAKVDADQLNIDAIFRDDVIELSRVSGSLNGGSITGGGRFPLNDLDSAVLSLTAKDVEYAPVDGSELVVDITAQLSTLASNPRVRGEIRIQEGTYEKKIDLTAILNSLTELFTRTGNRPSVEVENVADRPMVLDITLSAPNQLFLLTDFAEAELSAAIHVGGTATKPEVNGSIDLVSGTLTIGSRAMQLTNGTVRFIPGKAVPTLLLRGESSVVTPSLEEVNIVMTVTGPVNNPKVVFTADTGLSQQEIISMLTQGGGVGIQSLLDTVSAKSGIDAGKLFELPGFLGTVTKLDKLTVEPRFNADTGAVEPTVIAAKKIASRLSLQSETTFSGAANRSQFQGIFDLTKRVQLLGTANFPGASEQGSVGADIAVSLIQPRPSVSIEILGNSVFRREQILASLHLSESSRILTEQNATIGGRVQRFYVQNGFLAATVGAKCESVGALCKKLVLNISEGPLSTVVQSSIKGDAPAEMLPQLEKLLPEHGTSATSEALEQTESDIRSALRKADYLRARVRAEYVNVGTAEVAARVEIKARRPIRLVLVGNHAFTNEELLELIRFKSRRFPFGRNVAIILSEKIKDHYEAHGFLGTTVERKFQRDEDGITFIITVHEGERSAAAGAEVCGLGAEDRKYLRLALGANNTKAIFEAKYFVPAEVSKGVDALKKALELIGFPEADIRFVTEESRSGTKVRYCISRGPRQVADKITVVGLPDGVKEPERSPLPFSRKVAERYREECAQRLSTAGFRQASVEIEADPDFHTATFHIDPGEPTRITAVTFSGLKNIREEVLMRELRVSTGDPWDWRKIGESRRRLTALGLFSQVDLQPADGAVDSSKEGLIVSVVERNLQSLRVGGGADSTYGVHIFGEGIDRSLFKDGRSLTARADLYYDPTQNDISKGAGLLRFTDPNVLDHKWIEDLAYRKSTKTNQEFNLARTSLSSSLLKTLDDGISYTVGHSLQFDQLSDVPEDVILSELDTGSMKLSVLNAGISYDKRDDVINTHHGYLARLNLRVADSVIGSDANLAALELSYLRVQPTPLFEQRVSFADSIRYAAQRTYGGTDEVPISQRYYLGGRGSVRGFSENSLGPRGELGNVIGGDSLFSNSTELRFAVTDRVSVHTFFDVGNVFLRNAGGSGLRASTGVGCRFFSPVGPIGVDIGFPLDREPGEAMMRFHFSIGNSF